MNSEPGILFINHYNNPAVFGGIPRKILLIAEWLNNRRILRPFLLTNIETEFAKRFSELGGTVYYIDMKGPLGLIKLCKKVHELIKYHDIRILQTHSLWNSLAGRVAQIGLKNLKHVFRVHTHMETFNISPKRKWLYYQIDRFTSSWIDRYCVLSHQIADELHTHSNVNNDKICVVRNGIPPLGPSKNSLYNSEEPVPPRFAVVGQVEWRKRQDLAISAVVELAQRGIRAELFIIGPEEEKYGTMLREQAMSLKISKQVHFLGYTDQVFEALHDIEVVVLPSDNEGIPTSIIEAMSIRRIVIATPAGATEELVRDGENGILIPKNDAPALADVLYRVFTTPSRIWSHMRNEGYNTWLQEYSLDVMMTGLMDVYRQLGVLNEHCETE